jgi:transcriptional regulator with XRE-family HTH domain
MTDEARRRGAEGLQFAEALRQALADSGISQRKLARRLDVSQAAVSQWVHGQTVPRPTMARRLEGELGSDPGSLLITLGYVVVDPNGKPIGVPEVITNDPYWGLVSEGWAVDRRFFRELI